MENKDGLVDGISCEYCKHNEAMTCPVVEADNWSRWKNFCSEFQNEKFKLNEIIPEIIKELIESMKEAIRERGCQSLICNNCSLQIRCYTYIGFSLIEKATGLKIEELKK